jgi:hypothetical protein
MKMPEGESCADYVGQPAWIPNFGKRVHVHRFLLMEFTVYVDADTCLPRLYWACMPDSTPFPRYSERC